MTLPVASATSERTFFEHPPPRIRYCLESSEGTKYTLRSKKRPKKVGGGGGEETTFFPDEPFSGILYCLTSFAFPITRGVSKVKRDNQVRVRVRLSNFKSVTSLELLLFPVVSLPADKETLDTRFG